MDLVISGIVGQALHGLIAFFHHLDEAVAQGHLTNPLFVTVPLEQLER